MMFWVRAVYVGLVMGCVSVGSHNQWLAWAAGIALVALMPPIQVKK